MLKRTTAASCATAIFIAALGTACAPDSITHVPLPARVTLDAASTTPVTAYLRGTGETANPAVLSLDSIPAVGTTAKYRDAASLRFAGGNAWVEVGTWRAAGGLPSGLIPALSDFHIWLGLKNSDDVGTRFDLRVEAYLNGTLVTSGQSTCIQGIARDPNTAMDVGVSFDAFPTVHYDATTDDLSIRVLTRIGTNATGGLCGGHSNAVGVRAYFDAATRAAQLGVAYQPPAPPLPNPWTLAAQLTSNRINCIWSLSATDLYVTSDWGDMFHSTDGGATWARFPTATNNPVYQVWGTSPTNLYVISWYGTLQHWNGQVWTDEGPGRYSANNALYRIWGSGANDIYAVGDDAMIWHYDGQSWSSIVAGSQRPRAFQGVWGSSATDVFIVGGSGGAAGVDQATIYHFDGHTWELMSVPAAASGMWMGSVWGSGPHDVYTVAYDNSGSNGILLHYDGTAWSIAVQRPYYLIGVGGTAGNDVSVGGDGGRMLHFDGVTWTETTTPTTALLGTIWFTQDGTGWAGGADGALLRRTP